MAKIIFFSNFQSNGFFFFLIVEEPLVTFSKLSSECRC